MEILPQFEHKFDMVFADPPYFLSNNGISIQSGKIVSVNKGKWDKSEGFEFINNFNRNWLTLAREKMKDNATIWISGTYHNIFSIAANLANRRFLGIDQEEEFLTISKNRKLEIENPRTAATYRQKISGFNNKKELELFLVEEPKIEYKTELKL